MHAKRGRYVLLLEQELKHSEFRILFKRTAEEETNA